MEESYEQGGFAGVPEFSRSNPKVRPFNGVGFKTHPRGRRLGSWAWDFPGLSLMKRCSFFPLIARSHPVECLVKSLEEQLTTPGVGMKNARPHFVVRAV